MKKQRVRRIFPVFAAVLLIGGTSTPLSAETFTGSGSIDESRVTVNGTVSALIISVTHPTSVQWVLDPNLPIPFVIPTLQITNNTICAVNVAVSAFGKNTAGSTLPFTDVAPTTFTDWAALAHDASAANLALGVKIRADGSAWSLGYSTETRWSYQTGVSTPFGTLPRDAVGLFEFDARHGLSFDASQTAQHDLVFMFTLN
jgi:hypothetical protein